MPGSSKSESGAKSRNGLISSWVDEHGDALYRFALNRVHDESLAHDLVQETFLAATKSFEQFQGDASVRTWLTVILRNKIVDFVRSRASRPEAQFSGDEPPESDSHFNEWGIWREVSSKLRKWNDSPHDAAEQRGFVAALQGCLQKLPPLQRTVITLKALDGLSGDEICKEANITPSNYWVLVFRARLGLRECLAKNWYQKAV